ncbi:hypothetical protein SEPCBS57363_004233 [Sporothrix epigloea]|uniref:rRNA-processing protein FYV7 n=1 Tax=Sporothrix epigloea TaxID=1892477 RepID=A0ABP0DQW1_9PEZI
MAERPADDAAVAASASSHKPKRSRTGIRAALPTSDDAWRRKLERTKESKVIRAKTLQTYHKVKARELAGKDGEKGEKRATGANTQAVAESPAPMHPERQARIDGQGDEGDENHENGNYNNADSTRRPRERRPPKSTPSYFHKAREEAAQKKAEAEARQADLERQRMEREEAVAQRKRHQKAMAKARRVDTHGGRGGGTGGDNQRRKLGRESGVLLYQVRKMMGK